MVRPLWKLLLDNGFNPMLVEHEYNRFCRMNGLNLKSLAHELVDVLKTTNNGIICISVAKD